MDRNIVLVIEDDKALREALDEKLGSEGFNIFQARNGEEGLSIALDKKPDLILLDIVMPRMDGISMLDELRKDEWGKNVPVIMLTNLDATEDVSHVINKGINSYLVKSDWKLDEIVDKINQILKAE
ncbi:response regulator [Patescibacteria group bacterium]